MGADPYIDELAWAALEHFRLFEARVERAGLRDLDILDAEWRLRGAEFVAPPNPFDVQRGMTEAEQRLLDFVESLILDVAQTNPRVNQSEVASWLARVAVGRQR